MAAVGSRYARAFADVVLARGLKGDQVRQELRILAELVVRNTELRRVWESPALGAEKKRAVLDAIVARSAISRPVRNFIAVLIDHERVALLEQIVQQFEQELDRRLGIVEAEITSARDLADEVKRALERQVEKMVGRKVRARYSRDQKLLGGAVVRVGSTIYDGSVLGQLNRIREQLSTA
jgi:F-type H+-transporting ATPase subunit delta